jgi:hypothetical protein
MKDEKRNIGRDMINEKYKDRQTEMTINNNENKIGRYRAKERIVIRKRN